LKRLRAEHNQQLRPKKEAIKQAEEGLSRLTAQCDKLAAVCKRLEDEMGLGSGMAAADDQTGGACLEEGR
jgi:hypothetical protein